MAAAEHALKKADLRLRGAELRAESAEAELSHLRKQHAVGLPLVYAQFHMT